MERETIEVHDCEYPKFCGCGDCETSRTMHVSPATAAHILGEFDVEKARMEAQHEKARKAGKLK